MSELESSIERFHQQIIEKMQNPNFSQILPTIQNMVKSSVDQNFINEGRFGNGLFGGGTQRWQKSKRAFKQGGQTLSDTGRLAASIQIITTQQGNKIVIQAGSNVEYATIHNFGGTIQMPARSRTYVQKRYIRGPQKGRFKKGTTFGRGFTTKAYTINIPARPYLVLQDNDILTILKKVAEYILK